MQDIVDIFPELDPFTNRLADFDNEEDPYWRWLPSEQPGELLRLTRVVLAPGRSKKIIGRTGDLLLVKSFIDLNRYSSTRRRRRRPLPGVEFEPVWLYTVTVLRSGATIQVDHDSTEYADGQYLTPMYFVRGKGWDDKHPRPNIGLHDLVAQLHEFGLDPAMAAKQQPVQVYQPGRAVLYYPGYISNDKENPWPRPENFVTFFGQLANGTRFWIASADPTLIETLEPAIMQAMVKLEPLAPNVGLRLAVRNKIPTKVKVFA